MKKQQVKGIVSLAVMVGLTIGLVLCSNSIYEALVDVAPQYQVQADRTEEKTDTAGDEGDAEAALAAKEEAIANATGSYIPGTYTATAKGYHGDITVTLTVSETAITEVDITGEHETPVVGGKAMEVLGENMILEQMVEVDAMTSATLTSNGVISAARVAFAQAVAE